MRLDSKSNVDRVVLRRIKLKIKLLKNNVRMSFFAFKIHYEKFKLFPFCDTVSACLMVHYFFIHVLRSLAEFMHYKIV